MLIRLARKKSFVLLAVAPAVAAAFAILYPTKWDLNAMAGQELVGGNKRKNGKHQPFIRRE